MNDADILVKDEITVTAAPETQVSFKNCATFTKCITKIEWTTKDDTDYLDLVMPMYNIIEYSSNYSDAAGSLWFHSKDEAANFNAIIASSNNFKSFKYKTKLLRNKVVHQARNNVAGILKMQ